MVIIYDKANTLTLPYLEGETTKYFKFVPGTNEVASETWAAIRDYNGARFEHYDRFLHALDEEAAGDEGINYSELTVRKLSELIENTMDVEKLVEIETAENGREKPRTSVLKEIDKQIEKISNFEAKVEESE